MEKVKAYCHKCKKVTEGTNPIKTKIRNERTKSGTVEAVKATCPCGNVIYKIIGH